MKKALLFVCIMITAAFVWADEEAASPKTKADEPYPWIGNYCMSFLTKTRSSKILPKGKWSVSLKYQDFDYDEKETSQGKYNDIPSGDWKHAQKLVFCTKFGWAKDQMLALGIPYLHNNFNYGSVRNKSEGIGNIYVFNKWNFMKETDTLPNMSVDFWYYFPSGDPDRMLGTDDDAYKITTEISKAWKDFSLHFNPGYKWNKKNGDNNESEINAAILFTPGKVLWPTVEYNYWYKQGSGHSHDIVPGVIWKYRKGGSVKAGVVINMDSTFTYRDRVGLVLKIFQSF